MKYLFLVCVLFSFNFLKAQADSCEIKIQVEGYKGGVAKLIGFFGERNYMEDSARVDSLGRFEFKRKSPYKSGYFYVIFPDNGNLHMILDQDQHFSLKSNKADIIGTMNVESSIDNQLLYESLKLQLRLDKETDSLNTIKNAKPQDKEVKEWYDKEIKRMQNEKKKQLESFQKKYPNSFFVKFKRAGQNPDLVDVKKANGDVDTMKQIALFRDAFWENVDFSDVRLLHTPVIINKLKRFITELTPQQPDSIIRQADIVIQKSLVNKEMFQFVSNWIALNYQPTQTKIMDGEAVFVHILDKYFTKELAYWMTEKDFAAVQKKVFEMKASLLNRQAPDVVSTDLYGNTKSIYELKEDYIVIFMYDPDCDHCQKETPELLQFYKEWKSKSVEVFAIVLNAKEQEWRDFVAKNHTESWINVFDPTNKSIYAKYFVDITPEIYVLNKERKIIGKNLHPEQIPFIINQDKERQKK